MVFRSYNEKEEQKQKEIYTMNEKELKAVELSDEDMETLNEEAKKKELSMEKFGMY